jgi:hypothetical protein
VNEENTWKVGNKKIKKKKSNVSDWLFVSETPRRRFCQVPFFFDKFLLTMKISETQQKHKQEGSSFCQLFCSETPKRQSGWKVPLS